MRISKLWLVTVTVLFSLSILTTATAGTSTFPDVPEELAESTALLNELGIMHGWDDMFWPDEPFTREQLAAVVVRMLAYNGRVALLAGQPAYMYADAPGADWWSSPYLTVAFERGLMIGWFDTPGRVFDPKGTVTFQETVTIVLRALGRETEEMKSEWPGAYLDEALAIGLITEDEFARGADPATRGEIARIVSSGLTEVAHAQSGEFLADLNREFIIGSDSPTPGGTRFLIHVSNNSDQDVTLSGAKIMVGSEACPDGLEVPEEWFITTTIPAGQTVDVFRIPPGPPWGCTGFYGEGERGVTVDLFVDGEEWLAGSLVHWIVGYVSPEHSTVVLLDNEDGTATITITVRDTTNRPVTLLDEESLRVVSAADYATWDREVDPPLATLGELVSIEETAPGEYTLIWAHEDGVYDVVVEVPMEVIEDLVLAISGNN